ncbi:MAG: VWA domain-containing protein [Planctomycetes bacterium]|nr:VWA domain-containing protein [Planctomycetota bacterium]
MPLFEYSEFDGSQEFKTLSAEMAFDKLSEHLLEHGEYVLRQLDRLNEDDTDLLKLLIKEGYLEKDEEGKLAVSARGVKRIESKALDELFTILRKDALGKHPTEFKGAGQVRHDDSKPYEFGDPVANLNLHETLKNAMIRRGRDRGKPQAAHLDISEEDFVVYETEYQTSCATVVMLDMSGSMARYGKFYHAKKVALALAGLIRSRYAEDTFKLIGFYTYASPLSERALLKAGPKPVSIFDSRVFLRVPLDNPPKFVPEHFTNIQAGLRFARNILQRTAAANKQIICITDGEPTAHLEGRDLVLMYPPSERTARATLEEIGACVKAGIQLSTFALIEDYFYLGLMNFVDQMARTGRGTAVYCSAGELGGFVLDSFVRGRRTRRNVS